MRHLTDGPIENAVREDVASAKAADPLSLDDIWAQAEAFGRVRIHSSNDAPLPNRYHCVIEFETIPGCTLEAASKYRLPLKAAIIEAIEAARKITNQFRSGDA